MSSKITSPPVLFTALGLGLGLLASQVLSVPDAAGYPAGAAVSYGANPLMSVGGSAGSSTLAFTAPSDQQVVVTDVVLTATGYYGSYSPCNSAVTLTTSGGETLGSFQMTSNTTPNAARNFTPTTVQHTFGSGLPVPAGEDLSISASTGSGSCTVRYTLSGYYAQP